MRLFSPVLRRTLDISDAFVVIDDHHLNQLSPQVFGTNCEFGPHDAESPAGLVPVLVDSRVEVISDFLEARTASTEVKTQGVGIVAPVSAVDLLPLLLEHRATAELALTVLAYDGTWVGARLQPANSASTPADAFVQAFELARQQSVRTIAPETAPVNEYLRRYAALLEFIDENGVADRKSAATSGGRATLDGSDDVDGLTRKVVEAQAALGTLQRKYEALAGSTLGQLTLRYWALKKGTR